MSKWYEKTVKIFWLWLSRTKVVEQPLKDYTTIAETHCIKVLTDSLLCVVAGVGVCNDHLRVAGLDTGVCPGLARDPVGQAGDWLCWTWLLNVNCSIHKKNFKTITRKEKLNKKKYLKITTNKKKSCV